jgi:hypothetical protein
MTEGNHAALHAGEREDQQERLVGVWELRSVSLGDEPLQGALPRACILFTPGGKFISLLYGDGGPLAAAFRAAFAYSGFYRVAGDAWITTLRRSWNDTSAGGEQTHFFRLESGRLCVRPGDGEFEFVKLK